MRPCNQYGNNWQLVLKSGFTSMSSQGATLPCRLPGCLDIEWSPSGEVASDQHDGDHAGPLTKPGEFKAPNSKQQNLALGRFTGPDGLSDSPRGSGLVVSIPVEPQAKQTSDEGRPKAVAQ